MAPLPSVFEPGVARAHIEVIDLTAPRPKTDHLLFLAGMAIGLTVVASRYAYRAVRAALWRARQGKAPDMGPYRTISR